MRRFYYSSGTFVTVDLRYDGEFYTLTHNSTGNCLFSAHLVIRACKARVSCPLTTKLFHIIVIKSGGFYLYQIKFPGPDGGSNLYQGLTVIVFPNGLYNAIHH